MNNTRDLKVGVVCNYPFPEGMAATTRITAFMKGLTELGNTGLVFVLSPSENFGVKSENDIKGDSNGFEYIYPGTRTFSKYKLLRISGRLYYKIVTCIEIIKEHKKAKIDYLLISNDSLSILFLFILLSRLIGIKPVFITDEYPTPIRRDLKSKIPWYKMKSYELLLSFTAGMIFMTKNLESYFNKKLNKPSFILPTIIDSSRFVNCNTNENSQLKYICYMGNMELAKDNIDNIVKAFSIISAGYPDLQLHLYGTPSPKDLSIIENCISQNNMHGKVFLKGRCDFKQVPEILSSAYILVSSQPNSKRAEGGFPTKLGEYMLTRIPIVLTDVGEIAQYSGNGEYFYLVPPENPRAYAETLIEIIQNYNIAKQKAEKAYDYVVNTFNYKPISIKLDSFLRQV